MTTLQRVAIGTLAAALVAAGARRTRALTPGGAVAATFVGGASIAGMGVRGGAALAAFFVSSSVLGRFPRACVVTEQRRGDERDVVQVLANGGAAALLSLANAAGPEVLNRPLQVAYCGAIATAAADTWATEIGSRWGGRPRSIATLRSVAPGKSGGVTAAGLVASLAGAATVAAMLTARSETGARTALAITAAGFTGSLVDSMFGATIQDVRWCPVCGTETEAIVHRCGNETNPLRGHRWCDNDSVNAMATAAGALTAVAIASAIHSPIRQRNLTAA